MYTDIQGNPLERNEWNHHHVHDRSTAKGKSGEVRRFIGRCGLLLPIVKVEHFKINELTNRYGKPLLPSVSLIYRINQHADNLPEEMNPYDTFLAISDFMHTVAERCPNSDHRYQAGRIAENYEMQTPHILAGMVLIQEMELVA